MRRLTIELFRIKPLYPGLYYVGHYKPIVLISLRTPVAGKYTILIHYTLACDLIRLPD